MIRWLFYSTLALAVAGALVVWAPWASNSRGARMTATVDVPAASAPARSTTTSATGPVPDSVINRARGAVSIVKCAPNRGGSVAGTGFQIVRARVITADHVISGCVNFAGMVRIAHVRGVMLGWETPAHDLAALIYPARQSALMTSLRLETARPYVGEKVAMVSYPGDPGGTEDRPPLVSNGKIAKTHLSARLTLDGGSQEVLPDSLAITGSGGALPGESGGPAIDSSGRVVGVIEGGNRTYTFLTPASALDSLWPAAPSAAS